MARARLGQHPALGWRPGAGDRQRRVEEGGEHALGDGAEREEPKVVAGRLGERERGAGLGRGGGGDEPRSGGGAGGQQLAPARA